MGCYVDERLTISHCPLSDSRSNHNTYIALSAASQILPLTLLCILISRANVRCHPTISIYPSAEKCGL
ncbi:hypothetical protein SCLCIDRAFT_1213075 [Scleroderma citrinum Foug A]|uniref:Uncharacterized protein n=1 Tax=Scleroderma citrinum Foug A TaxID=1036808 RepID=A0A0C3AI19_9AGAM|nr:hypothetical protein SCLCIDRAFT_1213075 [Scleroderma citrinum Foug A]